VGTAVNCAAVCWDCVSLTLEWPHFVTVCTDPASQEGGLKNNETDLSLILAFDSFVGLKILDFL
jgi:hypothetical protein